MEENQHLEQENEHLWETNQSLREKKEVPPFKKTHVLTDACLSEKNRILLEENEQLQKEILWLQEDQGKSNHAKEMRRLSESTKVREKNHTKYMQI